MTDTVEMILGEIEKTHSFEFVQDGKRYLIQPDNNKGCDYLSLWRMDAVPVRVCQALYDIFDGIDGETVRELLESSGLRTEKKEFGAM